MSLFTRRSGAKSPIADTTGYSLIDSRMVIRGDLETGGSVRVDGTIDGHVRRADMVVIGVGATMTGDIHAREVVIGGTVTGNVHATERVELQTTAIVTGDLHAQTVLVHEGGVVNGRVLMRPPETASNDKSHASGESARMLTTDAAGTPQRR